MADSLGPPQCNRLLRWVGAVWLKMWGWKIESSLSKRSKFVIILAPHTSNWDGCFILPAAMVLGLKISFLAKKDLFFWPTGGLLKAIGGIPVDRKASKDMVSQILEEIEAREQIIIGITPEGTRSLTKYWKSGFYHIARKSNLPLCFAYLDYERKRAGFDDGMLVSGDVEKDLKILRKYFGRVKGKYPHKAGVIGFKPRAG